MMQQIKIIRCVLIVAVLGLGLPRALAQGGGEAAAGGSKTVPVPSGVGYSCPFCDLKGLDLSGRDLTDANLEGADLSGANLKGARLDGAVLAGANLEGANLEGAKLNTTTKGRADLSDADLKGADLRGAELNGTDLEYTVLEPGAGIDLRRVLRGPKTGAGEAVTEKCGNADLSKLTSKIYVKPQGNDTDTCGDSDANACKTIGRGIARCPASGCGVLVSYGEYRLSSTIALRESVGVFGGCYNGNDVLQSLVIAPPNGQPAVQANQINQDTLFQGFKLQGTPSAAGRANATYVVKVSSSQRLSLIDTRVLADFGASGGPQANSGAAGANGGNGGNGSNGNGGAAGGNAACSGSRGGGGSIENKVSTSWKFPWVEANCSWPCGTSTSCAGLPAPAGTKGGLHGKNKCDGNCPSDGGTGLTGDTGVNGRCSQVGGPASQNTLGSFSSDTWSGSVGGQGKRGDAAAGGGGGGAGGYKAGVCVFSKKEAWGNAGGGGGAGGCGSAPGEGGNQGGASFGIAAFNSHLTLRNTTIVGGTGGKGQQGAQGGNGGSAGAGGNGSTFRGGGAGRGGTGGAGGRGGAASGSAGGSGGPAVGIVLAVGATLSMDDHSTSYLGSGGAGGAGGAGGSSSNNCTGATGETGRSGSAATTQKY